ncbi:MAG: twin-arginine translocase TatA/TatE family subunit [Gracilibacteraceae bacterium]|jgi:sec-independent protein translocase protein TatA|nr:twin-arginine translocase TatA/TatE family subunit [Gracilibacteraceae bacterium]
MPVFGIVTPTVAVVLLIVALIIFGPGKLPELGKSLGRGIREFKDATDTGDDKQPQQPSPVQTAQAAQPAPESRPAGTKTE